MKKSKFISKLFISLISAVLSVSLFVPYTVKAEYDYEDVCDSFMKHRYISMDPNLIVDALQGDIWGIIQDIYQGTISYKTWKDTVHACEVDPDGVHGGHGGYIPNKVWYTVLNDTENDLNNGNNYNYYTTDSYNNTSNYSVYNNDYSKINYTYNNQTYNYNYNSAFYNTVNNSYEFNLTNNTSLTVINNYNNTTVIDNGSTRVLYYRLPDGSNSLNMTEDIALNGYKTSLSVKAYENTYDSNDLVALYHFDGNELDSAYPTQTDISFDRNSIQYIPSTSPFNESLALFESSEISINKNSKFVSFRFYPLINDHFSLAINGTDIVDRESLIQTTYDYVTWNQTTSMTSDNVNAFTVSGVTSSTSNPFPQVSGYTLNHSYSVESEQWVPDGNNGSMRYQKLYLHVGVYTASSSNDISTSSTTTQRTYNIINNKIWQDTYSNLVNYNMWNYLTVNIDGSVYINGNDTNIDVDNTQNLSIEIGGDSVTYIDELALFNSDHNNYSPFYPYSSNIVYSVPEYYEYFEVPGIKLNQLVLDGNFIDNSNWAATQNRGSLYFNNYVEYTYLIMGTSQIQNRISSRNAISFVKDHSYYISYQFYSDYSTFSKFTISSNNDYIVESNNNIISSWNYNSKIINSNSDYLGNIYLYSEYLDYEVNQSFKFKDLYIIDLTLMFGSGYEPNIEWCDQNLIDYIAYNVNPDVTESPYNIETGYTYLKQVPTNLAKNNEILIQSIISVNSWKIGGYRSSDPSNGDVFANVDDLGYITSVQQYNGLDWVEVTAGLYNEYMGMWISALGFNIFNQNWEYTEYKYLNDGGSDSWLVRFLSDKFRNTDNILTNILERVGLINPNITINQELNNDYNNVINNYNINPYETLNNRWNDVEEYRQQIDLQAPEYNVKEGIMEEARQLKQLPEAIVQGFIDSDMGFLIFIPLLIVILRLIL